MGVWYLLDKNPYLSKCLLVISVICILVVSLDALYQYFMEINFFGNEKYNFARLTGMFGKEPIIGRYINSFFSTIEGRSNKLVHNTVSHAY